MNKNVVVAHVIIIVVQSSAKDEGSRKNVIENTILTSYLCYP